MKSAQTLVSMAANQGFLGGSYPDQLPHLTLTEAVNRLPTIIMEAQMDFITDYGRTRKVLSEATTGVILESAIDTLKTKIETFFENILKWVRSIIAKLKIQVERIYLTGQELYEKYKDKLGTDADYRELVFEGYRFAAGSGIIDSLKDNYDANIESLVKSGLNKAGINNVKLPRQFSYELIQLANQTPSGQKIDADKSAELNEYINDMIDVGHSERSAAMASVLAGRTLQAGWEEEVHRQAYGEKGPIRYGSDMFHPRVIGQVLRDNTLSNCIDGYYKLESSIRDYRSVLKGELSRVWEEFYEYTDSGNMPGNLSATALINKYYSAYISAVSDALNAAIKLKAIKINYFVDMRKQAVSMLIKMVNTSAGVVNDSADSEEDFI